MKWRLVSSRSLALLAVVTCLAIALPRLWAEMSFAYRLRAARRDLQAVEPSAALVQLRCAEELKPRSAETQYLLGVANRRSGNLSDSLTNLEQAEQLGWSRRSTRRQRMLAAVQGGDKTAEKELQKVLDHQVPDDEAEEIYEAFAKGYLGEFRLRDAQQCLDYWIEWRPTALLPRLLRAEIAGYVDDRTLQLTEFQGVLAIAPDNYEAHVNIGELLLAEHKVGEALVEFRWCLAERPHDPRAAVGMANCQRQSGHLAEAKQLLDSALRLEMSSDQRAFLLTGLGQIALESRELDDAIAKLSEAIRLVPSDQNARYVFGTALARAGQESRAAQELEVAKRLEGQGSRLNELQAELVAEPNNAQLRWEAAMILRDQDHPLESLAWLFSALRCDPHHAKSHAALADYYESQGQEDLAAQHRRPRSTTKTSSNRRRQPHVTP